MKENLAQAQVEAGTLAEQNIQAAHGYPTKEELVAEMRQAIDGSAEVKDALVKFHDLYTTREKMQKSLVEYEERKRVLTAQKNELSKSFGEGGEEDLQALKNINTETITIDDALGFLRIRLAQDGEMHRAVKDSESSVVSAFNAALLPLSKKYQQLTDERFNAFCTFVKDFADALFSATRRDAGDGVKVRGDISQRGFHKLIVKDVLRLRLYAQDIR